MLFNVTVPLSGENVLAIDFPAIQAQVNFLMGKILTIVEAAIPEKAQQKAVKDLMRAEFVSQMNHLTETWTLRSEGASSANTLLHATVTKGPRAACGTAMEKSCAVAEK